jgi:hypothetical protein
VKIKTKPLVYCISAFPYPPTVRGAAIRLPPPWSDIRLCVRQIMPGEPGNPSGQWQIDHYPTGLSAESFVPYADTRAAALMRLVARLKVATPRELRVLRAATADEVVRALM